jgi:hypothetical protein
MTDILCLYVKRHFVGVAWVINVDTLDAVLGSEGEHAVIANQAITVPLPNTTTATTGVLRIECTRM